MHSYISFAFLYNCAYLFAICSWFSIILFRFFTFRIACLLSSDCSHSILMVQFTLEWMVGLEISTIKWLFLIFSHLLKLIVSYLFSKTILTTDICIVDVFNNYKLCFFWLLFLGIEWAKLMSTLWKCLIIWIVIYEIWVELCNKVTD